MVGSESMREQVGHLIDVRRRTGESGLGLNLENVNSSKTKWIPFGILSAQVG